MEFTQKKSYGFQDLVEIVALLRSENGCPWDKEQDHKSIRRNFIEETYEAVEAIDNDDIELLREELGDVLLQVVFHAQMERERGSFQIEDVADGICKKLIYRHPHVFKDTKADSSDEVLRNWDALKKVEKGQKTVTESMESVSRALPSLIRAEKIQDKAAKVGFDWDDIFGAMEKVKEEFTELENAIEGKGIPDEEIGDLLFAVVNVARYLKKDAEKCLGGSCDKFIRRFSYIEQQAVKQGKKLTDLALEEMDALWEEKKRLDRSNTPNE